MTRWLVHPDADTCLNAESQGEEVTEGLQSGVRPARGWEAAHPGHSYGAFAGRPVVTLRSPSIFCTGMGASPGTAAERTI
jgi:hypothetical protein